MGRGRAGGPRLQVLPPIADRVSTRGVPRCRAPAGPGPPRRRWARRPAARDTRPRGPGPCPSGSLGRLRQAARSCLRGPDFSPRRVSTAHWVRSLAAFSGRVGGGVPYFNDRAESHPPPTPSTFPQATPLPAPSSSSSRPPPPKWLPLQIPTAHCPPTEGCLQSPDHPAEWAEPRTPVRAQWAAPWTGRWVDSYSSKGARAT